METMLQNVNVPNTPIPAIDGRKEDPTNYIQEKDSPPKITNLELACTLSHLKAIDYLKNVAGDYFLVLEDDVVIEYDADQLIPYDLEYIITKAPEFDILQIFKGGQIHSLYEKWTDSFGACAYIISKKGVDKLSTTFSFKDMIVQNKVSEFRVSDQLLFQHSTTYVYKYNYIKTLDKDSTIHPEHLDQYHRPNSGFQKDIILRDFS